MPPAKKPTPKQVPTTIVSYAEQVVDDGALLTVKHDENSRVQIISAGPYGAETLYKYVVITETTTDA